MDILTRLHNLPPSHFHYKLLVLVGIGWLFDAMDTGLVSFVLPALGKDWALAPAHQHCFCRHGLGCGIQRLAGG